MKNKTMKKVWKSTLAILGIGSLALIGFSLYSLIYSYINQKPLLYLGIGLVVLFILVLLGGMSWKKIKAKIIDIFT